MMSSRLIRYLKYGLVVVGAVLDFSPLSAQENPILSTYVLGAPHVDAFQAIDARKSGDVQVNGDLLVGGVYQVKKKSGQYRFDWMAVNLGKQSKARWVKTFGGEGDDFLLAVKALENGENLLVGNEQQFLKDATGKIVKKTTPMIIRLDGTGEKLFEWRYLGSGGKYEERSGRDLSAAAFMQNGDIILAGPYVDLKNQKNRVQAWVCRINSAGKILWENLYGGIDDELVKKIVVLGNGDILLAGDMRFTGDKVTEGLAIRLDGKGKQLWRQQYFEQDGHWISAATQLSDGRLAIAGTYRQTIPKKVRGIYVKMLDKTGNLIWSKLINGTSRRDVETLSVTAEDDLYLTGSLAPGLKGKSDIFIARYSPSGKRKFEQQMGGKLDEFSSAASVLNDGTLVVVGQTSSVGKGKSDGFLFTVGQNGRLPNFGK